VRFYLAEVDGRPELPGGEATAVAMFSDAGKHFG